jgi:thioredoxin reductase/Pyruvate/2-oxoacid:ferredoxin oxidoreductase delta subunit
MNGIEIGNLAILALAVGIVAIIAALIMLARTRRMRASAAVLAESEALGRDIPKSLHPVIDPDVCIGSLSCLKACPEGDILGVIDGAARLVQAEHCVGHGRCAAECPVGAIQLVFGTEKRGVDLPEVDGAFESSRKGVHVIGELGGMGLIKNAMRQGVECMEYLTKALGGSPQRRGGSTDVVIVGSGPAGLAAALGAKKAGLSYRLLEQSTLGGTVAHYPRHKVVMTEPVDLPFYGKFGKTRIAKKELLESFHKIVAKGGLKVEEGVKVVGIEGQDGAFEVLTEGAGRIHARKVVLAVGRRGTPRKLGVPGEELEKVTYNLADPEQYRGKKVLVVGGGDSALEAAHALVVEGRAEVILSYRGEALARSRAENRAKVEGLAREKRLRVVLNSEVRAIDKGSVTIEASGSKVRVPNDFVLVNVGGELPLDLLQKMGVGMRRYFGEAPGAVKPGRRTAGGAAGRAAPGASTSFVQEKTQRRSDRRFTLAFVIAGVLLLGFLAWHGRDYYPLSARMRARSPLHATLRPAGLWGHGIGIVATLVMMSNFLYVARKRFRFMTSWGRIRSWLHFHTFVGFMAPLVIAFHAAFQSRNALATTTAGSLVVVVITGLIGRYVYGLVPSAGGHVEEMEDLQQRFVRVRGEMEPLLARAKKPERLRRAFDRVTTPAAGKSIVFLLLTIPIRRLATRLNLALMRRHFPGRGSYLEFKDDYLRMERLRVQIRFYRSLKKLLSGWRIFHAALATFLVFVIAAHIGVSLYLGYGLSD